MQDAELLQSAVREAGAVAMRFFGKSPKSWSKSDGSLVTEADLAVNALLQDRLMGARPDYAWLSEESPDDAARLKAQKVWLLDPIDGTRSFYDGHDDWCIACGLIDGRELRLAAVYQPTKDLMYFAQRGKGASRNGAALKIADSADLKAARLASRAMAFNRMATSGVQKMDMSRIPQILRFCMVAEGSADILLTFGMKHDWDVGAGALLVTEAGGKVTTESGQEMIFNQPKPSQDGILAAGVQRHASVLKFMETT